MTSLTPEIERDNYTKMLLSIKVYKRVGGLQNMTPEQLKNMPKEVMISLAPNEIALVWDKLPNHLKIDGDIIKYRFCYEHYAATDEPNVDVGDGPIPRRLFCCYCKMRDVKITGENRTETNESGTRNTSLLNSLFCHKTK